MNLRRALATAIVAVVSVLASGCAGLQLEPTVRSFSRIDRLAQPPAFRFERLPSQLAEPGAQERLEALADRALFKAGLRRDDASPRYSVLVDARVERILSPWADPADPWGSGLGWGLHWGSRGWGFSGAWRWEQPWWRREVSVVVRELPGGAVVFEGRAADDGPWADSAAVLPALFEAALDGFPHPPPGPRRVTVPVPR